MSILILLIILLVFLGLFGGYSHYSRPADGPYPYYTWSPFVVVLLIILFLWAMGLVR